MELKPFCHHCHERHKMEIIEQVVIGAERGTTFLIDIQGSKCNALIDTGAMRSCISEAYFKMLPQQNLKGLHRVAVRSPKAEAYFKMLPQQNLKGLHRVAVRSPKAEA